MSPGVLAGIGLALALAGLVLGLWPRASGIPADPGDPPEAGTARPPRPGMGRWRAGWIGGSGAAALVAVAATGWPVAGLLVLVAALLGPRALAGSRRPDVIRHVEAIAVWTELLRDTLAAASGLGQAIVATAPLAPDAIRRPVDRLADRLVSGVALEAALIDLAADLDDRSGDVVVAALLLAARARASRLTELLGALAESMRDEVNMRLRVEAGRASARSGVRTIVVFSGIFAALLALFGRGYLAPFGSPAGQVVLSAVVLVYASALVLMFRLVRARPSTRMFSSEGVP